MRKHVSIALFLAASCSAFAISSATFTGGRGDGYAHGDFLTPQPAAELAHFLGGVRDGYSSSRWRTYQPASDLAQARFAGNSHDGYASARFFSIVPPASPAQARFVGNGFDGYASSKMLSSWLQTKPKRFFGGGFDGYDRRAVLGLPNWAIGDTDGNGLPDWWELKYFSVLTGTNPNGDPDHDGVSNLNEYLTGTNPTNAVSYFHITRVTTGSPKKIFVYCAPGFYYTLQRADDLTRGWTIVTNQTRISPATEGVLEMDDFFTGSSGFYRVLLEH
jgi:hypothetical protein